MPMSTKSQRICPSCGNELSGAMEFCPVCMLRQGLAGEVGFGDSTFEDTVKPARETTTWIFIVSSRVC
jgi:hypothetical protein